MLDSTSTPTEPWWARPLRDMWAVQAAATLKGTQNGSRAHGSRSGKHMDACEEAVRGLIAGVGVDESCVHLQGDGSGLTTLPGFYLPTKDWDLIAACDGLFVAYENRTQLKNFGNNFRNRIEELIGLMTELRVAYESGVLAEHFRERYGVETVASPYRCFFLVLAAGPKGADKQVRWGRGGVRLNTAEYDGLTWAEAYDLIGRRLMETGVLENFGLVIASPDGSPYRSVTAETSGDAFVQRLQAHVRAAVGREEARPTAPRFTDLG